MPTPFRFDRGWDFAVAPEQLWATFEQTGRYREWWPWLKELDITCVEADKALPEADVVILAIPDNMIEKVTAKLVDKFKQGATLIALDAAAPFAGHLPERKDLTIFVAHPCHPPIFNDETDMEAKRDYFGASKPSRPSSVRCCAATSPTSRWRRMWPSACTRR